MFEIFPDEERVEIDGKGKMVQSEGLGLALWKERGLKGKTSRSIRKGRKDEWGRGRHDVGDGGRRMEALAFLAREQDPSCDGSQASVWLGWSRGKGDAVGLEANAAGTLVLK